AISAASCVFETAMRVTSLVERRAIFAAAAMRARTPVSRSTASSCFIVAAIGRGVTHRHPNRPLPRRWLMTDERQGETLWAALDRLPRGAGVIVRHYSLPMRARRRLFARFRRRTA